MEQKRFITAMVLSGIVLLIWQMFFAPRPEDFPVPEQRTEQVAQPADTPRQEGAPPDTDRAEPDEPAEPTPPRREIEQREDTLASENVRIGLSNRGAAVHEIHVVEPEQYSKRGDLLNTVPVDGPHHLYSIAFLEQNVEVAPDAMYELVEDESVRRDDGTYSKITYRYDDPRNRFRVDKVYTVDPDLAFVVDLDVNVTNRLRDVRLIDTYAIDLFGRPDPDAERNFLDFRPDELEGVCRLTDDNERVLFQKLEGTQRFDRQPVMWGAIDTRYFLLASIPDERGTGCVLDRLNDDYLRARVVSEGFSIAPGETHTISQQLYMGPKDFDSLDAVGQRLEESIDYGLLTILARPLRWMLALFHGWVGNWGIAIILLTLLIKLLTWPITDKAYVNAERMKLIQPRLQEIKKQYENDQQRMTEETMKVFRENKVSPLGCLPMLIQMPILYALFVMIYNSVELYQAEFALWYTDLSARDPYFVLPILMGAVMVIQQRMTVVDTGNPQMATMMKIMPIIFTAFMLFLPSGLVLYYFVNLILGLGQQYWIKRKFQKDPAVATA